MLGFERLAEDFPLLPPSDPFTRQADYAAKQLVRDRAHSPTPTALS
jgi:hypothetical protein